MAIRYVGDAIIHIIYVGGIRDEYKGSIVVPGHPGKHIWRFNSLYAPACGFKFAYDSSEAYDQMAESAVSFGSYYTTHNRSDAPDWAPDAETADAIERATSQVLHGCGSYEVRRKKEGDTV
jgi:hypothetical protein